MKQIKLIIQLIPTLPLNAFPSDKNETPILSPLNNSQTHGRPARISFFEMRTVVLTPGVSFKLKHDHQKKRFSVKNGAVAVVPSVVLSLCDWMDVWQYFFSTAAIRFSNFLDVDSCASISLYFQFINSCFIHVIHVPQFTHFPFFISHHKLETHICFYVSDFFCSGVLQVAFSPQKKWWWQNTFPICFNARASQTILPCWALIWRSYC